MIKNNRYCWSHLKTKTVTVSVRPKRKEYGVVFRVGNMIDLGCGRQTVMLEHLGLLSKRRVLHAPVCNDVAVPFRMGPLNFVYTSREKPEIQNVYSLLSALYNDSKVEKIVPEVLCPGDLLVFGQKKRTQDTRDIEIQMVDALRPIKING